jgi:hypothetical protein
MERLQMRNTLRLLPILVSTCALILSCSGRDKARVTALEASLKPFSQIEINTGSNLNVGPDALPYLRRLENAQLITISEVAQDYWGGFASRTFMEGAKPYSIQPTKRLAELALNPRSAPTGVDLPVNTIKEDLEGSWNFYAREEIFLGLNLLGNTTSFARAEGDPPSALTLMSDYPKYQALASKGLLLLEDATIPPAAYSRAKLERAVRVSLTPAGERVATLDKKANTATFVFATYSLEDVLVNTPIETSDGVYRLVEGTHVFDLKPEFADLWATLGWPEYRERRFRVIYTFKGYEQRNVTTGTVTMTPPEWRVATASNGRYSAKDTGPRTGAFESSNVPPTEAALRSRGTGGEDKYTWRIHPADLKVGEVLRDDEYKGPLATPGESFRLVLASIQQTPPTGKGPIPADLAALLPGRLRAIVKYDEFNKSWTVVALDVGPADADRWYSSNVR